MSASRKNIWCDESGAALLEFTAAAFTFFILLFGVIEFANVFYQWNSATKAVQLGARLAAVSDPLTDDFLDITNEVEDSLPGDPLVAGDYDMICDGSTAECTCTGPLCPDAPSYELDKMRTLVYGRCDAVVETCNEDGVREACNGSSTFSNIGMCNIFGRVTPENVIVRYEYTGLGYVGRPGGAVPTITVSLTGLTYDWIMIGALTGFSPISLPSFATTVTGEDLNVSGS